MTTNQQTPEERRAETIARIDRRTRRSYRLCAILLASGAALWVTGQILKRFGL